MEKNRPKKRSTPMAVVPNIRSYDVSTRQGTIYHRKNSKSNNYCLIDGTRIQKGKDGTTSFCQRKKESVRERESEGERERYAGGALPSHPASLISIISVKRIPLSRAHEKEEKKKKKKKLRTKCVWERRKKEGRRSSVYFFMVAGMRASMGLPSAASFSISMRRATPSQTNWRSSTSE